MANQQKRLQSFDTMIRHLLKQCNFATRQDIDQLTQKIDKIERKLSAIPGDGKGTSPKVHPSGNGSASDMVLDVIADMATGANFVEIQEKTRFNDKKLRNIIYRLNKQGKIQRKKRGVYIPL